MATVSLAAAVLALLIIWRPVRRGISAFGAAWGGTS
jgi:phosphotransferase system  glucose/maltose/N-acetylglucosamine-specific IIC component